MITRFFSNKLFIIAAIVIVAFLITISFLLFRQQPKIHRADKLSPRNEKVVTASPESPLKDGSISKDGIKIVGSIINLSASDQSTYKAGDSVRIKVGIENNSDQQARFLTIKTNLSYSNFTDIGTYVGLTGLSHPNDKIEINNVLIRSHQSQDISFDGKLFPKTNGQESLQVSLNDGRGNVIVRASDQQFKVSASKR